jgi:hypothetical protein
MLPSGFFLKAIVRNRLLARGQTPKRHPSDEGSQAAIWNHVRAECERENGFPSAQSAPPIEATDA